MFLRCWLIPMTEAWFGKCLPVSQPRSLFTCQGGGGVPILGEFKGRVDVVLRDRC